MSTRSGLRVWLRRSLGVATLLALAPLAVPPSAAGPAPVRLVAVALPATGIPVVVDDTPPEAAETPAPAGTTCAAAPVVIADRDGRPGTAGPCPSPSPAAPRTVTVLQPLPAGSTPAGATQHHPATPRPASPAAPAPTAAPEPVLPVPIPPPLVLTPAVVPVPESYAPEHAPASVLLLGFGSVVLASAAMVLRMLRRGR